MRATRAVFILSVIPVVTAGCYRYTPATTSPIAGSVVRFQLSDAGAQAMARVLGRNAIGVDGTILSTDDTSFAVSMSATRQRDEPALNWAGERVIVPKTAVQSIEARSLDRKKTLLVGGLAILGAIAAKVLVSSFDALAGGDDGGPTTPPP